MASKVVNGVLWTQTVNAAFPNVHVSLNSACQDPLCYGDWTYGEWSMVLQRRTGGTWRNIGSRTGYVSSSSPTFAKKVQCEFIRLSVQVHTTEV